MKQLILQRRFLPPAALFCSAACSAAGNRYASAQTMPIPQNPRAIVTQTDAYEVGSPLPLAGAYARAYPDPRGRYVLFVRTDKALPDSPPSKGDYPSGRTSLSLYDSRTQGIREIWTTNPPIGGTGAGAVNRVEWLSGVDAALIVTRDDPSAGSSSDPKPEYTLRCVHPDKGLRGLQTLLKSQARLIFRRSPSAQYAVVEEFSDEGNLEETIPRSPKLIVDDRGQIGPVLHLDTDLLGLEWSEDGKTLFASVQAATSESLDNDPAASGRHKVTVAVDAATGNVQVITTRPKNRQITPSLVRPKLPPLLLRIVTDAVTSTLPGKSSAENSKPGMRLTPLYLQYAGTDHDSTVQAAGVPPPPLNYSVFLADNGSDAAVLSDLSAVIYYAHDALFAVPIVHETRNAFDKGATLAQQKETEAKLKTIASAIEQYMGDSDGHNYPPAANLAQALKNYLSDPALLGEFTYLLNGNPYPGDASAPALVVGYLPGPGGRAVLTGDGQVRWEGSP